MAWKLGCWIWVHHWPLVGLETWNFGPGGLPPSTLSAGGPDLLQSLEAIVELSAHDKVLLWAGRRVC